MTRIAGKNKLTLCGIFSIDFGSVSQEPNNYSDKGQSCCSVCNLSLQFGIQLINPNPSTWLTLRR